MMLTPYRFIRTSSVNECGCQDLVSVIWRWSIWYRKLHIESDSREFKDTAFQRLTKARRVGLTRQHPE
jgi:hypothetical protein